jgi:hypothetical protein
MGQAVQARPKLGRSGPNATADVVSSFKGQAKIRDGATSAPVQGEALPLLAVSALATLAIPGQHARLLDPSVTVRREQGAAQTETS